MSALERYERQQRIAGWDQEKLTQARVTIVGANWLAYTIGLGLASAGVGMLYFLDDRPSAGTERWFPHPPPPPGTPAVQSLAAALGAINPLVRLRGLPLRLYYPALAQALPPCSLLIHTCSDLRSQAISLDYGRRQHIPVILATSGPSGGSYQVMPPTPTPAALESAGDPDQPQGAAAGMVIGGAVVMEALQILLALPGSRTSGACITYASQSPERFGSPSAPPALPNLDPGPRRILVVGAGALGNFVALTLAQAFPQLRLRIVDPDIIEEHNRNRQPAFWGQRAVGKPKARTLAQQLKQFNPGLQTLTHFRPVTREDVRHAALVFLCVDSFAVRAEVNRWAVEQRVPLINGGTSPFMGEVEVYCPGRTGCLNDYLNIQELAVEENGARARCGHTPEASVVATNQLIGGLMVGEMGSILAPDAYGPPLSRVLAYEAQAPARFGTRSPRPICQCSWSPTHES